MVFSKNIISYFCRFLAILFLAGIAIMSMGQVNNASLYPDIVSTVSDSIGLRILKPREPIELRQPSNITTEITFDPESGLYVVRSLLGNKEIISPLLLSADEYNSTIARREMFRYFNSRNSRSDTIADRKPFDVLNMKFGQNPLDKVFGPGGVRLNTQGSVQLNMGIQSNKTDNPALPLQSRRKTFFKFDQKIQANISGSVGQRLNFNMSYNTNATFDFDSKNIKINYTEMDDDIIKSIEAGNVSMSTGSSLIRGGTALFGIKTKLQFGKLSLTGIVSQQNSESRSVSTQGGVQSKPFSVKASEYDANRHFFLAQYFYDHYDESASRLPLVMSGINITRLEVWVTNKTGNYSQSRNLVAFSDIGENKKLTNGFWKPDMSVPVPSNSSNNLLEILKSDYPDARNINTVTQALQPLATHGIIGGVDYEKVESARLLHNGEYSFNASLGYISLNSALNTDEVLAVAFEYTYQGKAYQVGEFSNDIPSSSYCLYLKMLRATTLNPKLPIWRLMMKNVYSLGQDQIQRNKFKLDIKFLSDTTGTEINYLPIGQISNKPLLQIMNLDRIDSNQESNPDGFFDFIEGYTILPQQGKVIFPVTEPFGSHLEKIIGNPALSERYVYRQLYDSVQVVAKQYAERNKFSLQGEYQASGGSSIRLNALNVPRGSVVVTAGGTILTENSDYTVDYAMGIVTITNQSIIDSGTNVSVTLENQSMFSMQRKTLLGLDAQYRFNNALTIGGTIMNFSEKSLTEKVGIGQEVVNNTMFGINFSYNKELMWLTNILNKVPTINATVPSSVRISGEFARLSPGKQESSTAKGSSYIDDFESAQSGIDLRNPYSWTLASTPYESGEGAMFPEAALSNNVDYGKNRALLAWNYIDRMWTQKNSTILPGYLRNDLKQLSNPYVREVLVREIYPGRDLTYGASSYIQTLNLSFYPNERGPYNMDTDNIDDNGNLLFPEKRWGGIMRKMNNTNFENSNVEYIEFWLLDPFLDPDNQNRDGGDLYFNLGEISEDILKDGMKSYENGIPIDGDDKFLTSTNWGRVSKQNSLTYAFENAPGARLKQDLGLDGLSDVEEHSFHSYADFLSRLKAKLSATSLSEMEENPLSPLSDPAQDNYHFYRSEYYDRIQASILDRYKRYNGVEGNSLSPDESPDKLYQSSRNVPDVEDINQDNTLNEYERYFQYKVSIRPEDLVVGRNFVTDRRETVVPTRDGNATTIWYQFKIPLSQPEKRIGGISDFSTIRFARIFMTGFKETTHLRFASLELVRGEWRNYENSLSDNSNAPAEGNLDLSTVNIEENYGRKPVNYVLPPDVSRIQDSGQMQALQLNEQSMSLGVTDLPGGASCGAYKNTQQDMRLYRRLQMWVHAEAPIDNPTDLKNGELALVMRLGTDIRSNYYEYEIPLELTPAGNYNNLDYSDREEVWPLSNRLDVELNEFTNVKTMRNRDMSQKIPGVGYGHLYSATASGNHAHTVSVMGNPSLSDVRTMLIGIKNKTGEIKNGTVWVNELRVTDFNEEGGWAAKLNANVSLSDLASVNVSFHKESTGFGGVDQSLTQRRLDDYNQYSVALQGDIGKLLPSSAKLTAPVYYSRSSERNTPKYNPLDNDILLKESLKNADRQERDSIMAYAVTKANVENFALSNMHFNVRSKNPMPWDPANFQLSFSVSKRKNEDPTTEYRNANDYRGAFQYSFTPFVKPLRPFSFVKGTSKNARFLKDWGINWMFNNLTFLSNISRYYYEEQTRSQTDIDFQLPVQVSKNFIWDRQLSVTWNIIPSLSLSFASNTTARIEETLGAVNRRLFPDKYREWRDTVWNSIKHLGTPWNYNQTFTGSYRAPFNKLSFTDFLTGNLTYSSTYRWDRGAVVEGLSLGNSINNQSTWNSDARVNFDLLFNKSKHLKRINQRFSDNKQRPGTSRRPSLKKFERAVNLNPDTVTRLRHNLRTKRLRITATKGGEPFKIHTKVIDDNTIEILDHGAANLKVTVAELRKPEHNEMWNNIGEHALRFLMMPKSLSFRWRGTHSLNLPQFSPEIGDAFGQSTNRGPMAPGLDFAFGFFGESYVDKALSRGWLLTGDEMASPAIWNNGNDFNLELILSPAKGLKIVLTGNLTDNRTKQIQFMYPGMPSTMGGSYVRTHVAIASALKKSKAENGYRSEAFDKFLSYIPLIAERLEERYSRLTYPSSGFMEGSILAGMPYNPSAGPIRQTSPDVMIPAFIAAYSGKSPDKVRLNHFPGLESVKPNWRITYEGLTQIGKLNEVFKSITLSHAYQCTYSVGNYSSYLNWVSAGGDLGFIYDELSQHTVPSSPFSIPSVTITERFAPLVGVNVTLKNNLQFNAEYRDQRSLNLNTSAGQIVETTSTQFSIGSGIKIPDFNRVLRYGGSMGNGGNDLTVNLDVAVSTNQSLIRRIATAYTQATHGSRTFSFNFMASYQMSRKITVSAFFDHQVNTPLVTNASFPTSNSNYGIAFNISLAR